MAAKGVFIMSAALIKDGRVLAKMNMRDEHRARDNVVVLNQSDDLFDEALTYAVSYVVPLADGGFELKVRMLESDSPSGLESASRTKIKLGPDSVICQRLKNIVGAGEVGKQIWLDPAG